MNARQRRYLVASLRSVSVLLLGTYLAVIALHLAFGVQTFAFRSVFSPLTLAALALTCGAALWLAHFFKLGNEVRVWTLAPPRQEENKEEGDCPPWPTIFAWLITDLEGDDAQRVGVHVSGCDKCRRRLALMGAVQEMSSDRGR